MRHMPMPPAFHELARKVNNWGRWGADDEMGTLLEMMRASGRPLCSQPRASASICAMYSGRVLVCRPACRRRVSCPACCMARRGEAGRLALAMAAAWGSCGGAACRAPAALRRSLAGLPLGRCLAVVVLPVLVAGLVLLDPSQAQTDNRPGGRPGRGSGPASTREG